MSDRQQPVETEERWACDDCDWEGSVDEATDHAQSTDDEHLGFHRAPTVERKRKDA